MIYLDNSATTKQHRAVTEIMIKHMEETFGNPSSLYQLGVDSEKSIKAARKQLTNAFGMPEGSITFTSGGTETSPSPWSVTAVRDTPTLRICVTAE